MANLPISGLTASASNLASTDLAPVVQTVGVGPVKMTGLQLAGGLLGSTTFNGATSVGTALSTVAITGTGGQFSCAAATLAVGQNVTISGTLGGTGSITGYSSPTTYTISATNGSTTFTLVNASTGAALTTTVGTPTGLTYVVTSPVVNFTQTWNNSNVTFTGLKFNATDTLSASGSLLLDLQVGGTSKFKVRKDGALTLADQAQYTVSVDNTAAYLNHGTGVNIGVGTAYGIYIKASRVAIPSAYSFGWSSAADTSGNIDTILTRANTATLQLGAADVASGAVAQTLQVQSNTGAATTGPNFTIKGSSGTTAGGSIIFQTHNGTAYGNALTLASSGAATFGGSVTIGTGNISYLSINPTGYTNGIILSNIGSNMDIALVSGGSIHWSENTTNAGSGTAANGVWLWRDAANTLALRNGAGQPQTFNVYNTYTSAADYVRFEYLSTGISQRSAGTGTGNESSFDIGNATGTTSFYINVANGTANRRTWQVQGNTGHFFAVTDNTFDIGASGASRPRNIYAATSVRTDSFYTTSTAGFYYILNRFSLQSAADGTVYFTNAAGTDFNRLQFGGTTSSFPAIKKATTGVSLQVRLADDTGDAAFQCGTATSGGTAFNVNGTGGNSIASVTNTTTGTLLQVLNSTSNPLMTVTDTTSGTLFSVQSTTAATLFSVNDTTSGTLLAVTNSSSQDIFSVTDAGVFGADGASANVLAIKNSTTEQRLRIYNTTASGGSYFFVGAGVNDDGTASANTLNIGTGGAGAVLSKFAVVVNGTTRLNFNVSQASAWTTAGAIYQQSPNTTQYSFIGAGNSEGYAGTSTNIPFVLYSNNVARVTVGSSGGVTLADANDIAVGTTTGTKIGTATSQKIGFWNATPIVQPTTAVAAATVAATGTGDVVAASTTFDGYTIPQIVKAMRDAGLLA